MYPESCYDDPASIAGRGITGPTYAACFISALGLAAALGLSGTQPRGDATADAPMSTAAAADAYRPILDALLTPAIEVDTVPLRWVDPRASLRCGPHTEVRVNGQALVPGALVPDMPFELEWRADECHPFAAAATRLDGDVKLTVFREDWGFSAMVEPSTLRLASGSDD